MECDSHNISDVEHLPRPFNQEIQENVSEKASLMRGNPCEKNVFFSIIVEVDAIDPEIEDLFRSHLSLVPDQLESSLL